MFFVYVLFIFCDLNKPINKFLKKCTIDLLTSFSQKKYPLTKIFYPCQRIFLLDHSLCRYITSASISNFPNNMQQSTVLIFPDLLSA